MCRQLYPQRTRSSVCSGISDSTYPQQVVRPLLVPAQSTPGGMERTLSQQLRALESAGWERERERERGGGAGVLSCGYRDGHQQQRTRSHAVMDRSRKNESKRQLTARNVATCRRFVSGVNTGLLPTARAILDDSFPLTDSVGLCYQRYSKKIVQLKIFSLLYPRLCRFSACLCL